MAAARDWVRGKTWSFTVGWEGEGGREEWRNEIV